VEDQAEILAVCQAILERLGYSVLTATTSAVALSLAESHPGEIHLLLTDVVMPGMNGPELNTRIKAFRPAIRTIFMTGYGTDAIVDQERLDGRFPIIGKPFTVNTLASTVRSMLDPDT
jgi:DNA-binding NtrC family response regulator